MPNEKKPDPIPFPKPKRALRASVMAHGEVIKGQKTLDEEALEVPTEEEPNDDT